MKNWGKWWREGGGVLGLLELKDPIRIGKARAEKTRVEEREKDNEERKKR